MTWDNITFCHIGAVPVHLIHFEKQPFQFDFSAGECAFPLGVFCSLWLQAEASEGRAEGEVLIDNLLVGRCYINIFAQLDHWILRPSEECSYPLSTASHLSDCCRGSFGAASQRGNADHRENMQTSRTVCTRSTLYLQCVLLLSWLKVVAMTINNLSLRFSDLFLFSMCLQPSAPAQMSQMAGRTLRCQQICEASVSRAWNMDTAHQSSRAAAKETCRAVKFALCLFSIRNSSSCNITWIV